MLRVFTVFLFVLLALGVANSTFARFAFDMKSSSSISECRDLRRACEDAGGNPGDIDPDFDEYACEDRTPGTSQTCDQCMDACKAWHQACTSEPEGAFDTCGGDTDVP